MHYNNALVKEFHEELPNKIEVLSNIVKTKVGVQLVGDPRLRLVRIPLPQKNQTNSNKLWDWERLIQTKKQIGGATRVPPKTKK